MHYIESVLTSHSESCTAYLLIDEIRNTYESKFSVHIFECLSNFIPISSVIATNITVGHIK